MIHKQFYYKQHLHLHSLSLTSNDITFNILHPHHLQYVTPTNMQIFKWMLYLHFPLILVTILNLFSTLEFRTYICVHSKSLTRFSTWRTRSDHFYFFYEAVGGPKVWSGQRTKSVIAVFEWLKIISTIRKFFWIIENFLMIANCYWSCGAKPVTF